jgi:hypothetical protein
VEHGRLRVVACRGFPIDMVGHGEDVPTAMSEHTADLGEGTPWLIDVLENFCSDHDVKARRRPGKSLQILVPCAVHDGPQSGAIEVLRGLVAGSRLAYP